jgi:hypothetical protein
MSSSSRFLDGSTVFVMVTDRISAGIFALTEA